MLLSAAGIAGDVLKLNNLSVRVSQFLLAHLALEAPVTQIAPSHNDKNQCRDAKDDSYTEGLIMNREI